MFSGIGIVLLNSEYNENCQISLYLEFACSYSDSRNHLPG